MKPARNIIVTQLIITTAFQKVIKVSRLSCIQYSINQYLALDPFLPQSCPSSRSSARSLLCFFRVFVQNKWHDSLSKAAFQRLLKRGIWKIGRHCRQLVTYTGKSNIIRCIIISLLSLTIPKWVHWKKPQCLRNCEL